SCSRDVALTVQVSERYFPSLEARISIDALSKSGAWRSTTARMACANPSSVRPTIFIGNAQGNSRSVSVISIGPIWGRSAGRASLDAGTPIHVFARRRVRQLAVGKRPTGEQLKNRQPAALERVRRSGEVDAPDAEFLLADLAPRGVGVALQPVDPVPQGARIVLAQRLRVDQLQSGAGETLDHPRYVRELPTGKNIFLDEIADAAAQAVSAYPVMRDAVIEHQPAGFEDAPYLAEV